MQLKSRVPTGLRSAGEEERAYFNSAGGKLHLVAESGDSSWATRVLCFPTGRGYLAAIRRTWFPAAADSSTSGERKSS